MTSDFWPTLFVFVLASFIGLGVIRRVSRLLHTRLMSLTNAISAIAVVGASSAGLYALRGAAPKIDGAPPAQLTAHQFRTLSTIARAQLPDHAAVDVVHMARMFDGFFRDLNEPLLGRGQLGWPHVDVRETDSQFKV